jgi:hypothetical protein
VKLKKFRISQTALSRARPANFGHWINYSSAKNADRLLPDGKFLVFFGSQRELLKVRDDHLHQIIGPLHDELRRRIGANGRVSAELVVLDSATLKERLNQSQDFNVVVPQSQNKFGRRSVSLFGEALIADGNVEAAFSVNEARKPVSECGAVDVREWRDTMSFSHDSLLERGLWLERSGLCQQPFRSLNSTIPIKTVNVGSLFLFGLSNEVAA